MAFKGNKTRLTRAKGLATKLNALHATTQSTVTKIKDLQTDILTIVGNLMQTPSDYKTIEGWSHPLDITAINAALDSPNPMNGNANIALLISATVGSIAIGAGKHDLKLIMKIIKRQNPDKERVATCLKKASISRNPVRHTATIVSYLIST